MTASGPDRASARDYFALLGVPRRYHLDIEEVEANYRERSKEVHPDRHVGSEASERIAALDASMRLNEAVKTLTSPARRAEYLLGLWGVEITDHERLEPGLVMELLEAREELAEAQAEGDDDKLEELEERMLDRKDDILATIGESFSRLDDAAGEPSADALEAIKKQVMLLRYVDRYLEQFEEQDEEAA